MDAKKMKTTKVKRDIFEQNIHLNTPHPKESVKKKTFFQAN